VPSDFLDPSWKDVETFVTWLNGSNRTELFLEPVIDLSSAARAC